MKKLHLICGMCGCADELTFEIDPHGSSNFDGANCPAVIIRCANCSTLTSLDEHIEEKKT